MAGANTTWEGERVGRGPGAGGAMNMYKKETGKEAAPIEPQQSAGDSWGHKLTQKGRQRQHGGILNCGAISSKPVAWGYAEQNRASFH